ncbi:hypothetical protein ACFX15_010662 [Malus domestica]|uniref:putative zinc finger protein At1g68190 isoform X2 n=1 Tax=Malus sylvestris TaxID=3752 RepID=UPI0021AD1319|nr:putative zinc finger protein At1g68190 isoform X2 [Malus sylvestris]
MKKSCDLCLDLRPVVYCKADAAHLCLPCDAKVHSANPIVDSHQRTLLCDSCKYRSADDQCLDHRMFMCRVCDQSLHRHSSRPHQKRTMISSYTGCPSAKEFAAFWGFKLNENLSTSTGRNVISSHGDGGKYQKSSCSSATSSRKFECNEELPFYTESSWHCRSPVQNSQLWSQNMQDLGVCEEQTYDHADLNMPDVDSTFRNFEESFGADQYVSYEGHARAKEKYDYKCRAAIHESYAANSRGR